MPVIWRTHCLALGDFLTKTVINMHAGYTALAVGIGAAVGALLRHGLNLLLGTTWSLLPVGTLVANLIAAYVVGVAMAFAATMPDLSPLWRLLIVTGFAGGLSTFSTFAGEMFFMLKDGRIGASLSMLTLHLGGSLAFVLLGTLTIAAWRH